MAKKQIDHKADGVVSFEITAENKRNLDMLSAYAQRADAWIEEKPNLDGLLNYIFSRGAEIVFKELAKAHGVKVSAIYEMLCDENDVLKHVEYFGKQNIMNFAQKIVNEQPMFDGQGDLFEEVKK